MIRGYMPQGNIDESVSAPKGQYVTGNVIGILCLDTLWMPLPPGCVMNASTFDFPVAYKILEGMKEWVVKRPEEGRRTEEERFSPKILNKMIEGGKELQRQGVRALVGACGYFANFQKGVAAALDIPVFLSSLIQVPLIRQGLKPGQKIGVITDGADWDEEKQAFVMMPRTWSECGVDDTSDIVIPGGERGDQEFWGEIALVDAGHNTGCFNPFKAEQDLANVAKRFVKDNPEIGAILLECSAFPPYAWAVQNAVNLPVFDFYTLIDWVYKAVVRRPFAGFY